VHVTIPGQRSYQRADALHKAGPIVLEPIVHVEITAPASAIVTLQATWQRNVRESTATMLCPTSARSVSALVPLAKCQSIIPLKALTEVKAPTQWN